MRHQRRTEPARANGGQFLGLGQAVKYVEAFAMPAIFLRVTQPQYASLSGFLVERAREFTVNLPLVNMRRDLARDKASYRLRQRLMTLIIIGRPRAPIVKIAHLPVMAWVIQ